MKVYEVILKNSGGETVYKSMVPEVHVKEKIDTLFAMNQISEIGGIFFKVVGDISDRYIQTYMQKSKEASSN